jgi:hypothetical protein
VLYVLHIHDLVKSTSYKAPHYVIFSIFPLFLVLNPNMHFVLKHTQHLRVRDKIQNEGMQILQRKLVSYVYHRIMESSLKNLEFDRL